MSENGGANQEYLWDAEALISTRARFGKWSWFRKTAAETVTACFGWVIILKAAAFVFSIITGHGPVANVLNFLFYLCIAGMAAGAAMWLINLPLSLSFQSKYASGMKRIRLNPDESERMIQFVTHQLSCANGKQKQTL